MAHNLDITTLRVEWMLRYLPLIARQWSVNEIQSAYYAARLEGGDIIYPQGGG